MSHIIDETISVVFYSAVCLLNFQFNGDLKKTWKNRLLQMIFSVFTVNRMFVICAKSIFLQFACINLSCLRMHSKHSNISIDLDVCSCYIRMQISACVSKYAILYDLRNFRGDSGKFLRENMRVCSKKLHHSYPHLMHTTVVIFSTSNLHFAFAYKLTNFAELLLEIYIAIYLYNRCFYI